MRNKELVNKLSGFNDFGKEINHLKVRKAKVGSYLDELSQSDIEYCNYLLKNYKALNITNDLLFQVIYFFCFFNFL